MQLKTFVKPNVIKTTEQKIFTHNLKVKKLLMNHQAMMEIPQIQQQFSKEEVV